MKDIIEILKDNGIEVEEGLYRFFAGNNLCVVPQKFDKNQRNGT